MDVTVGSILAPFVAVAAMLLGISLLVQVLQELWKFSTSSKAIAFEKALDDFVGTWASAHLRQNTTMAVRGPLQFRRVSKAGHVLPIAKGDLIAALEQASPAWYRLIDQALEFEAKLQQGSPGDPSPQWTGLIDKLRTELATARPATQALEMHDFLKTWGIGPTGVFDAAKSRLALRRQFFAHLAPLENHYERLMQNYQYTYQRRNLRQTFTWALAIALLFNLPLGSIYRRAATLSLADALSLSERAQALHDEYVKLEAERPAGSAADTNLQALQAREQVLRKAADEALEISSGRSIDTDVRSLVASLQTNIRSASFLIGCLLTAILVSFGAPFWNDISAALYRVAKPAGARQEDPRA
jgi:hypothetical protein